MKTNRLQAALLTMSVAALMQTSITAGETAKQKKQDKTAKLTINDLPKEVKATLEAQAGRGKIVEVKQKTKKGRMVYHADILTNGKDWEVDVVADDTLLKNKGNKCMNDCSDGARKP